MLRPSCSQHSFSGSKSFATSSAGMSRQPSRPSRTHAIKPHIEPETLADESKNLFIKIGYRLRLNHTLYICAHTGYWAFTGPSGIRASRLVTSEPQASVTCIPRRERDRRVVNRRICASSASVSDASITIPSSSAKKSSPKDFLNHLGIRRGLPSR